MKKQLLIFILLLTPACAPSLGKTSDVKPTPVASKSAIFPTPTLTPLVSSVPSDFTSSQPPVSPISINIEKKCLVYSSAKPVEIKIDPSKPDVGYPKDYSISTIRLKGTIYDKDKKAIQDAIVRIELLSNLDSYCLVEEVNTNFWGKYNFGSFLDNTKLRISVSKIGYKSISRTEILIDRKDPNYFYDSIIDFGGDNPKDSSYFLEKI